MQGDKPVKVDWYAVEAPEAWTYFAQIRVTYANGDTRTYNPEPQNFFTSKAAAASVAKRHARVQLQLMADTVAK